MRGSLSTAKSSFTEDGVQERAIPLRRRFAEFLKTDYPLRYPYACCDRMAYWTPIGQNTPPLEGIHTFDDVRRWLTNSSIEK